MCIRDRPKHRPFTAEKIFLFFLGNKAISNRIKIRVGHENNLGKQEIIGSKNQKARTRCALACWGGELGEILRGVIKMLLFWGRSCKI